MTSPSGQTSMSRVTKAMYSSSPDACSARTASHVEPAILWSAGGSERFYDTQSTDANLYGWQTTDENGSFCFRTLKPLPYGKPTTSRRTSTSP